MRLHALHQVAGRLENLEATQRFYDEVLGARCLGVFEPPGLLFYDFAGTRLLLERGSEPASLYFRVDDIEAARTALSARGAEIAEAHMIHRDEEGTFDVPGSEEWMAFFNDPSGNTLALVERRLALQ